MSTRMTKSDCGCGCGSGASGAGCGCGGHGTGVATCADGSFKRPRFFAGQLLTEDDLQSLADYVVGKNRLHNRFFFGDGVVCGLTATCDPCGKGHVTVAPGFALDCCGNDLLIPCKEDLDVKALLRDLTKRQLAGYDCGDPCDKKDGFGATYGLYLVYTETLEDPVAPYSSGDPCGQQACEPTRICEGYRFELRCDCDQPARIDLFKRIAACIGDLRQAAAAVSRAQTADLQARQLQRAASVIKAETAVPFEEDSVRVLREVTPQLAALNEISLDADLDEDGVPKLRPEERALRLDIARLQLLTGAITRFRALPEPEQQAAIKANPGLSDLLDEAAVAIAAAGPRIALLGPKVLTTPAARAEAEESVRLSSKYVLEEAPEGRFNTVEARLVALNNPVSYRQLGRMKSDAALLKDWLLDKLAGSASLTRCDLYDRLRRVQIEAPPGNDVESDLGEIRATSRGVRELVQILFEYLIDCVCLALNPPCMPCDDNGVLLACMTIKDCEVVDICNMSRRFVLTPVALRYWLPPIGVIGDFLKAICCDFDVGKAFGRPDQHEPELPGVVREFIATRPEKMGIVSSHAPGVSGASIDENTAVVLRRLGIEPVDLEAMTAFSLNLALLSGRAASIDLPSVASRAPSILASFARPGRGVPPAAAEAGVVRADVADVVAKEVSAARTGVERELTTVLNRTLDTSVAGLRADLARSVTKDLGGTLEKRVAEDVKGAVARELTEAKLRRAIQGTDTVKELKEANRTLARDVKKLTDAIEAMKKGGGA